MVLGGLLLFLDKKPDRVGCYKTVWLRSELKIFYCWKSKGHIAGDVSALYILQLTQILLALFVVVVCKCLLMKIV